MFFLSFGFSLLSIKLDFSLLLLKLLLFSLFVSDLEFDFESDLESDLEFDSDLEPDLELLALSNNFFSLGCNKLAFDDSTV